MRKRLCTQNHILYNSGFVSSSCVLRIFQSRFLDQGHAALPLALALPLFGAFAGVSCISIFAVVVWNAALAAVQHTAGPEDRAACRRRKEACHCRC